MPFCHIIKEQVVWGMSVQEVEAMGKDARFVKAERGKFAAK